MQIPTGVTFLDERFHSLLPSAETLRLIEAVPVFFIRK